MSANPTIKVITFDLDDTLWSIESVLENAEQAMFNWLATHTPDVTHRFDKVSLRQLKQQVLKQNPSLQHQISELRIVALRQAIEQAGYSPRFAEEMAPQAFAVFLHARHQVTLFDDALTTLEQLHPDYTLGVLTNGNADVSRLPIGELFDFSFAAEQLNASKPAPDHFLAAMAASGAQADEIVHVGDHLEHDIEAALAAGCYAIWFNPGNKPQRKTPGELRQIQQLSELPSAIRQLQQGLTNR